jgi:hypothetical protein
MIGRQARPCTNLLGMYRRFGVVPQGFFVLFPVFLVCFRDLALRNLMGEICGNPSWFFCL